jgi:two-component system, LuxR family, response regulator FixJ
MANGDNKCIFFVDDEPKLCEIVGQTLRQICSQVSCFASAADCLEQLTVQRCSLLITDLKMPEMDGIELLIHAKRLVPEMPVLVVTAYGDITTAVTAIQAGAAGFIEKPLERETFLRKVLSLLDKDAGIDSPPISKKLTKTEHTVLKLIVKGKSSKEISHLLHRSIRTIEWHRDNIMGKLGVDNVVGLIKRTAFMGLVNLQEQQDYGKASPNEERQE